MQKMRKKLVSLALVCAMAAPLQAAVIEGNALYDHLFKTGTLDHVGAGTQLVYTRQVSNSVLPEAATRDTGQVVLTLEAGETPMAALQFQQDGKHRNLGTFPASIGNPMIMYFAETVARDMAETAGGSPFYIRNRLKEALVSAAEVSEGTAMVDGKEVPVSTITMVPFANDPNRARMQGFADLTLTVTVSKDVPGWYLAMAADAQHDGQGYRSETRFMALEAK